MPLTNAQKQSAHRAREKVRTARMKGALAEIIAIVEPRQDKPVSKQLLAIALKGLE